MNRIEKVQSRLKDKNCPAILVTSETNRRYVSGVHTSDGYIVVTPSGAYYLIDFRYIEMVKRDTAGFKVELLSSNLKELLTDIVRKEGISSLLFEESRVTCSELERLRGILPEVTFEKSGRMLEELRTVKDESELASIVKAQRIAEEAFLHVLPMIKPAATEKDIALELEYYMRKHGAEASAFDIIGVSGANSSLPHGVPGDSRLTPNSFLTMDFGAKVGGYCSDMTRTVVVGRADAEMKKIYSTVLKAQTESEAAIKEGVTGAEIDKIARDIIYGAGYENCFGHGLGHGVGLEIHEEPRFSPRVETKIPAGAVLTVEPGIYLEGRYGVRIEDMVVIRPDGSENITKAKKELLEL